MRIRPDAVSIPLAAYFHACRPERPDESMPIYEYKLLTGDCKVCGGCFELRRPAGRPPLTACPLCKRPVQKVVSTVNSPRKSKPASVSEAKQAGFQILKRRDEGVYERL